MFTYRKLDSTEGRQFAKGNCSYHRMCEMNSFSYGFTFYYYSKRGSQDHVENRQPPRSWGIGHWSGEIGGPFDLNRPRRVATILTSPLPTPCPCLYVTGTVAKLLGEAGAVENKGARTKQNRPGPNIFQGSVEPRETPISVYACWKARKAVVNRTAANETQVDLLLHAEEWEPREGTSLCLAHLV